MTNNTTKPTELRFIESKNAIYAAVNNALQVNRIPCYLLEPVINDVLSQIKAGAKEELKNATEYYNKQLEAQLEEDSQVNETSEKED